MFTTIPFDSTDIDLIEENQLLPFRFSFCISGTEPETLQEITPKVQCRDFLGDVIISEQTKIPIRIYGFTYNPQKTSINHNLLQLLLTITDSKIIDNIKENLDILHKIEEELEILEPTCIHHTNDNSVIYVASSPLWMWSTIHLSFYTFILKALGYKYKNKEKWIEELCDKKSPEGKYAKKLIKKYSFFIFWLNKFDPKDSVCGWFDKRLKDPVTIHNCSGFVSLLNNELVYNPNENIFFKEFNQELQLYQQGNSSEMQSM